MGMTNAKIQMSNECQSPNEAQMPNPPNPPLLKGGEEGLSIDFEFCHWFSI
jgi:hypothetical protein